MLRDPLFDVSKEIVLITGASGQLGMQYAKTFLQRDSKVVCIDIKHNSMVQSLMSAYDKNYLFVCADVTDVSSLRKTLCEVQERFGVPTVLINNAAIDSPPDAPISENGPFEEYPDDSWDKVMDVNLKGVYLCCKVFGAVMAKNGKGSIVNVSSIYGVVSPDQSLYEYRRKRGEVFYKPVAYAVSKAGILNLTRYLAVYWAKRGVRVNSLVIGGVFNNQDREFLDAYCGRIPVGRMAHVDEYNGAVLFLASPASSYMTGAMLVVDGGWTAI